LKDHRWAEFGETELFAQPLRPCEIGVHNLDLLPTLRQTPGKYRERLRIEVGKEQPKWLDCFETDCVDRLQKPNCKRLFGLDESD
jgi:hypothetical protein